MTTVKTLIVATALLASGSSLALAQTPPTTGPSPPANITSGPGGAPAYTSGPNLQKASRHATRHHKMYMSAKGSHHKALKAGQQPQPKTGQQPPKQPQ